MADVTKLNQSLFRQRCQQILAEWGMPGADAFEARGVECAFRHKIVRESTDGMFRSDETWLCTFVRSASALNAKQARAMIDAAVAADVQFLLSVVFGAAPSDVETQLRRMLDEQGVHLALLTDSLAAGLVEANGKDTFSLDVLRRHARTHIEDASWRAYFQTPSLQPGRVLPLGRYQGDMWALLCEELAPGEPPISQQLAESLLASGLLVLLLDGINEVQHPDLQARLA